MSCTDKIELSQAFELDGKEVVLVDTPGFDDTAKSDSDVLNIVCDYIHSEYVLSTTSDAITCTHCDFRYSQGHLFHGILYLYRISDNRVSGTASRNLRFYQGLCGDDALLNSIIVTNMWARVEAAVGNQREEELKTRPNFFKSALDKGAQVLRHDGTVESAHRIVRQLIHNTPRPLQIQRELVDEGKKVYQTVAGEALLEELAQLQQKHLQEMQQLEQDMAEALREQDEEAQRELEEERMKVQLEQEKLEAEKQKLIQLRTAAQERAAAAQRERDEAPSNTVVDESAPAPTQEPKKPVSPLGSWFKRTVLSCIHCGHHD